MHGAATSRRNRSIGSTATAASGPTCMASRACATMSTFKLVYRVDENRKVYLQFFAEGYPYRLLGLFPTNRHLLGFDSRQAGERPVPARHRRAGSRCLVAG